MQLRLIAAATFLAGSLCAASPELMSLAMPDAKLLAGVNMDQLRVSPLGQMLMARTAQGQGDASMQALMDAAGFDPRRDLSELLLASTGATGNSGLIMARGTFDVAKILEAARSQGGTIQKYKGVPLLTSKDAKGLLAFPSSTLAILGDEDNVRAAIDRKSAPAPMGADLAAQANQLSAAQDLWFVSLVPPSDLHLGQSGAPPILAKVRQASGGLKFGANVVLTVLATAETEKDATSLAGGLNMLAGMVKMNAPKDQNAALVGLLQGLSVTSDGNVAKVTLSVPEEKIEAMFKSGQAPL